MREIFAGLLDSTNQLSPEMRKVSGAELADGVYQSLKGRKYMIVMDDMWDTKVWDEVKRFFPDEHNGSRVVLTTRLKNVGDHAASFEHRHDMRSIDSGESWDTNVPASISSLWWLQTLVMDGIGDFTRLPTKIWTMLHLRHVEIRNGYCELADPPNSNLVILANLQTLPRIGDFRFTDEIMKRIPKLKKLGVYYDDDWSHYHVSNIVCLNELESLHLYSMRRIALPPNFKFPAALKKLTLSGLRIGWEDLTMVGSLPNLEVLVLDDDACIGEVWEPNEGEFRHLKYLKLNSLDLVEWRADDSHFPELESLKISCCFRLKEIPSEIGNITTFEKIKLGRGNISSALASAKLILDQQRNFGNEVLQLRIFDYQNFKFVDYSP